MKHARKENYCSRTQHMNMKVETRRFCIPTNECGAQMLRKSDVPADEASNDRSCRLKSCALVRLRLKEFLSGLERSGLERPIGAVSGRPQALSRSLERSGRFGSCLGRASSALAL